MDSILDTAPCGYVSFTDDGTIQSVNQTLLDFVDRSHETVHGSHIEVLLSPGAKLFYHTHFFPLLKMKGEAEEIYLSLRTRTGDALPCLLNARRTSRNDMVINEVVLLPFKERDQYEDEILQAKRVAEQANRAKDKFLSTVSHELRTPISTIKSLSQYLSLGVRGAVTHEQRDYLKRIEDAADYLSTLINDILDFARLEAGPVETTLGAVSVKDALVRAESLLEVRFEEAKITYERAPVPSDLCVRADPNRLQQIMLNLLTNAIKFTPEGGSVTVSAEKTEDTVRIHVEDTGVGISVDRQKDVFDPFVQAQQQSDATTVSHASGVGLGLAISRDLAQAMGGSLTVDSREGEGSVFTVCLPFSEPSPTS